MDSQASNRRLRAEHLETALDPATVDPDPVAQFQGWFAESVAAGLPEPNGMALATAGSDGVPSVRTVLMRVLDNRGLVFYTNLGSRKSREIAANRRVAAAFTWIPLRRQVRIEGAAWPVADEEADAYFATRPLDARLGAHASPQSAVIPDRAWLVESLVAAAERFGDGEVPRPADWGGYRVVPDSFEFWQGRAGRLHDRVRYRPGAAGWIVERLAP